MIKKINFTIKRQYGPAMQDWVEMTTSHRTNMDAPMSETIHDILQSKASALDCSIEDLSITDIEL